jgi:pyruvate kinase
MRACLRWSTAARAVALRGGESLRFALENGVDAVSQSFVENAGDIEAVRDAARKMGKQPFIIAKIERSDAIKNFDAILKAADGIMVARGDLGVEVPIEEMAILQKKLIAKACLASKPVITATQMLESMTGSGLPTRAEATDVANAVLDGTDCIMLSAESAMGKYPEEAVSMLARIAAYTETHRPPTRLRDLKAHLGEGPATTSAEAVASVVEHTLETVPCAGVFVATKTGGTARMISRFKPAQWIITLSRDADVCQALAFSYGVHPVQLAEDPENWSDHCRQLLHKRQAGAGAAILVAGPSARHPEANHYIEFFRFGGTFAAAES